MSADPKKSGLRLVGKGRGKELQSAIVEWRMMGMSKSQAKSMARSFDEAANAPHLTDEEFARVIEGAFLEFDQLEKEQYFKDLRA